ncbi:hypothetical protein QFZ23_002554 [Arthrobacter globiformis]|nr:hypothetical protein [Arthrobacter globiformis]
MATRKRTTYPATRTRARKPATRAHRSRRPEESTKIGPGACTPDRLGVLLEAAITLNIVGDRLHRPQTSKDNEAVICPDLTYPALLSGGPSSTVGMYSSSWSRPSKVRLSTISSETSG